MNQEYAIGTYRNNQITTASQKKLIIMLYEGAIKNLKLARLFIDRTDMENTNKYLLKAQNIIIEFMNTLDFESGGEVAVNLHKIYEYIYNVLIYANVNKDVEKIDESIVQLEELRETWLKI